MDRMPASTVRVRRPHDGQTVVTVRGELDLTGAEKLSGPLSGAMRPGGLVVLEMGECPFMDSSGLRTLLTAVHLARESGSVLRLAAVGPGVSRVIELTGVRELPPVFADVDAALATA